MLKIFQFQNFQFQNFSGGIPRQVYCRDFRRIIICVKFIPCSVSCAVIFFLNEKTLLVLFILPSSFYINLPTIRYLSSSNKVKIYPG